MLTGTWILVLLPLMDALTWFGWGSNIPVPTIFDFRGTVRTLDETLASDFLFQQPLLFCIGVVLLFSKEQGRHPNRLDWTRRWGVLCSYVVLLLSAVEFLLIAALVVTGVAAVFQSMPLKYQPQSTRFFVEVSTGYLRYGPHPKDGAMIVLFAFSSIAVLLACVPLFEALFSSGSKRLAAILVAPLALFSLMNLAQVGGYFLLHSGPTSTDIAFLGLYFRPHLLVGYIAGSPVVPFVPAATFSVFATEATKWCIVFGIAIWLSIAQLAARAKSEKKAQRGIS